MDQRQMQLKCPACDRRLKVPDTAAGKIVKCPCGKQLRVPVSSGGAAPASTPRPTSPSARPSAPANAPPATPQSLSADAGAFDNLSDADWGPLQSAPVRGSRPTAASNPYAAANNPYAAPASAGETSRSASGPDASKIQRFVNLSIDQALIIFLTFVVGVIVVMVTISSNGGRELSPEEAAQLGGIFNAAGFVITLLYYIVMEAAFGATIGKFCTGTRVVSAKGGRAGIGAIIGRTFARFIPFEPFSFFGSSATGWHDSLSGTRVITVR